MKVDVPVPFYTETEHKWQRKIRAFQKRFQVVCWHRRARKTTMALNILIQACAGTRNKTYGYVGPTYEQTKSIAVVDPMMLKRYLPKEICRKPFNESELRQEFITGSVLEMKGADKPERIAGVGWQGVILEEWAKMKNGRQLWEEILQPILRENNGWALFIFTPKGKNFAYEYFMRAGQDTTGEWGQSLLKASESGIIFPDELIKAKENMPERLYMQEFECAFLEGATSVFHDIEQCVLGILEPPQPNRRYIMGVDLGRTNDYTVLTVMDIGTNKVVAHQRFSDTSWALQKTKIVLEAKKYNNAQVVIDATGFSAGSVVAEDLKEAPIVKDLQMVNLAVIPFKFTHQSKKALVEKLIISIEQRLITFPKIDALVNELQSFTYDVTQFGNIRYSAPEGMYDDCVISLGLAVWGLGSYIYAPLSRPHGHKPKRKIESRSNI